MVPFIGLNDLGWYLRKDVLTEEIAVIAIDSACQAVRDELQQQINYEDADGVTLDGTGSNSLVLPELPVIEVIAVSIIDPWSQEETLLTPLEDYTESDSKTGILYRNGCVWPLGFSNIGVVYSHGYDVDPLSSGQASGEESAPDIPSSIRLVALQIASRVYAAGTVAVGGVTSETIGKYSYSLGGDPSAAPIEVTVSEKRALARYRAHRGVA